MQIVPARRRLGRLATAVTAIVVALNVSAAGAAQPGNTRDDEGGTATLREQLEAATKGYLDAKLRLENSQKRQTQLNNQLRALDADLARHSVTVGELAAVAYRGGRLGPVSALLSSDSPAGFVDRAVALGSVAANQQQELKGLLDTRDRVRRTLTALAAEVQQQRKQLQIMAVRKTQAERALAVVGGLPSSGHPAAGTPQARPAPRNPDGSWPRESCSLNDPTTSGCITPRTLHALNQAKAAGFTRFVSCFRGGGSGEHPKGRACDYAAQRNGFGGDATGSDRVYGNNLANYFIRNANRLGVLYVI
jgi:peptidoglycan DL-endopeptidase CwlO